MHSIINNYSCMEGVEAKNGTDIFSAAKPPFYLAKLPCGKGCLSQFFALSSEMHGGQNRVPKFRKNSEIADCPGFASAPFLAAAHQRLVG
jgi:hypothetical protein